VTSIDTAQAGAGTGAAAPRVLVAGIGNIFLSDDGFGVEVIGRLADHPIPEGVKVVDFGIRGLHLAYELLDGYDVLVLVDALPIGEAPGTVALVEAEMPDGPSGPGPDGTAPALANLGGSIDRVLVVGCQPESVTEGIGLSASVAASVENAVTMVAEVLADLAAEADPSTRNQKSETTP